MKRNEKSLVIKMYKFLKKIEYKFNGVVYICIYCSKALGERHVQNCEIDRILNDSYFKGIK